MVQEIREMIRTVYGKYDVWLRALGKFSLAFGSLLVIGILWVICHFWTTF